MHEFNNHRMAGGKLIKFSTDITVQATDPKAYFVISHFNSTVIGIKIYEVE
jgi:hypothetical protein